MTGLDQLYLKSWPTDIADRFLKSEIRTYHSEEETGDGQFVLSVGAVPDSIAQLEIVDASPVAHFIRRRTVILGMAVFGRWTF
jgi:hypothetical protein